MSTTILSGLAELGGDLDKGAVLTELLTRFMKNTAEDRQAVEIETLASQIRKSEGAVVHLLAELIADGILVREGAITPAPGSLLAITKLSITFGVTQGGLDFGAKAEEKPKGRKSTKESKQLSTPERLDKLEDDFRVGEEEWKVSIKPVYLADSGPNATEYAECGLFIWVKDSGDEWEAKILDKHFEGPSSVFDAWAYIREFTGMPEEGEVIAANGAPSEAELDAEVASYAAPVEEFIAGLIESSDGTPIGLDEETFAALVETSQAKDPDNAERRSLCDQALADGCLIIGEKNAEFRRVDIGGARLPSLPPPPEPAKKPRTRKAAK